jgi:hypothetical protein
LTRPTAITPAWASELAEVVEQRQEVVLEPLGPQPAVDAEAAVIGHPAQEVVGVGAARDLVKALERRRVVVRIDAVAGLVLGAAQRPGGQAGRRAGGQAVHGQQLSGHLGLAAEERHVLAVGLQWVRELHQAGTADSIRQVASPAVLGRWAHANRRPITTAELGCPRPRIVRQT